MELKEIESAIEGILFAAGEPVGVERLCLALDIDRDTADAVCRRLADQYSYERRGIRLLRLDSSYQLCSAPEYAGPIRKAFEAQHKDLGFGFVELLSGCPTNLHMTPLEATRRISEALIPCFPLGVYRDITATAKAGA